MAEEKEILDNENTEKEEEKKTEIAEEKQEETPEKAPEEKEKKDSSEEKTKESGESSDDRRNDNRSRPYRPGNRGGSDNRGGGGRRRDKRFFYTKKVCKFCTGQIEEKAIDYKNVDMIRRFTMPSGKIVPRRISGNCAKHQRRLTEEIKKARILALLPFVDR